MAARRAEARGLEERGRRRGALVLADVVALAGHGGGADVGVVLARDEGEEARARGLAHLGGGVRVRVRVRVRGRVRVRVRGRVRVRVRVGLLQLRGGVRGAVDLFRLRVRVRLTVRDRVRGGAVDRRAARVVRLAWLGCA